MRDSENLYDKIKELIGKDPKNFSVMDDNIDVDLQLEYFEFSRRMAQEFDIDWALDQLDLLEDKEFPSESKKQLLARLASIDDVTAYRAIESYSSNPAQELREWSRLALHESRFQLESHLLEENQVFISTGLGGKNSKLRYFVVLIARDLKDLTPFQRKIIQQEFPFVFQVVFFGHAMFGAAVFMLLDAPSVRTMGAVKSTIAIVVFYVVLCTVFVAGASMWPQFDPEDEKGKCRNWHYHSGFEGS